MQSLSLLLLGLAAALPQEPEAPVQVALPRPGPVAVDPFHPDRERPLEPRGGGVVTVHVPGLPASLNYMVDHRAVTRNIGYELHESLVRRDWETWEYEDALAESWTVQDALLLAGDGPWRERVRFGRVEQREGGWRCAGEHGTIEPQASEVERLLPGTVFTFQLRPGVRWHDGQALGADDVLFSYQCYRNPFVDCDRNRYQFEKIVHAELVGERGVRFFFGQPYFLALSSFDESLTILPRHVFDLSDPDNPDRDPGHDQQAQGRFVNEHPANREWIGLGPYRLSSWDADVLEAERFEGYYDPAGGGRLERLRWRGIADVEAAKQALLAGELDYFDRLSSDDWFGAFCASGTFRERCTKGYNYTPYAGYTVWNTKRPQLSDARVRRALGMAFDLDEFVRGFYRGLAFPITGEQFHPGPNYDRELAPLAYDLETAAALLAEAGWYDRDGDGAVDKEGEALVVELLMPTGNAVSRAFGQRFQESLAAIGVRLELAERDFSSLAQRVRERDFDAYSLGLVLQPESDPEQLWHSRWAQGSGSNRSGLADERVDLLIEAIQVELDPLERARLFQRLQVRLQELQPVLFGVSAARRFAVSQRVRGLQSFALDPGYSLRRWFVVED